MHRPLFVTLCLSLTPFLVPGTALGASRVAQSDVSPIAESIATANAALERIAAIPHAERTFENTVGAMDATVARFFETSRIPGFMAQVSTDADERARGSQASEDAGNWYIVLNKHQGLYEGVKAFAATNPELDGEQQRLVDMFLRDFRREGLELDEEKRARLLEIDQELNTLGLEFSQNIRDDDTALFLTREELAGLPPEFLDSLPVVGGLIMCEMKGPVTSRLFSQCEVGATRQKAAMALSRRAGTQNVAVLESLIRLRHEKAQLLGYENIAEYQTETRMAKTAGNVWKFYEELRPKLREKAQADFDEFQAAKREHTGDPNAVLNAWDTSFYKSWLSKHRYAVDSEKVREYFPMAAVVDGLFSITQELYGVEYREVTEEAKAAGRPVWHEDVHLYEVRDKASGDVLGEFYTDLHPRSNKYNHAAQFPLRLRRVWEDGTVTRPLVALVCNFTKPTADKPALLSHSEVETFFHEFGHCLHSIFSEATYANFSGTNVSRDFVEAPSQMFENWVWDPAVLKSFARHYETGQPFPDTLIEGMLAARNLGSGLSAEGQVFLGQMDMTFHTDEDGLVDTTAVRADVYRETRMFEPLPHLYSQGSFGHMTGYFAGYYGYLWSLVYAQDMFSRFKTDGVMNAETGMAYRKGVLARGGTRDELEMVSEFLGREPNSDAFLEHLGLKRN